jgi:DNA-binding MarR family transcriptional regulator
VDDAHDTIMWLMKRAFSLQRRSVEEAMREHGVTAAQAGVLTQLLAQPGLSSSDIARNLLITAQAATVAVIGLEGEGLIERRTDANHARIRRCFLTEEGKRIAEACFPVAHEVERKLLALFDDDQRAQLAELLKLYLGELPSEARSRSEAPPIGRDR